jgi:small-conductance mechanosensitive channel
MATGNDERGAARLESTAGAQESAAQAAARREVSARQAANASSAEVAAAQRRLAALQDRLRGQRATLARLRAEGSQSAERTAELARLQTQLDALDRAARRTGSTTAEELRRIEIGSGDLGAALNSLN